MPFSKGNEDKSLKHISTVGQWSVKRVKSLRKEVRVIGY